jgi:hypothetical protein
VSDWIGWIATAIFAVSYFCKRATTLRWVQGIAALVWISYGVVINAPPVILANAIVAALAGYSAWRQYGLGIATSKRSQSVDNPRGEAP